MTTGPEVAVRALTEQLQAFALWALDGYVTDSERIGDIDGYALEQKALELGLLVECGDGYQVAPQLEVLLPRLVVQQEPAHDDARQDKE